MRNRIEKLIAKTNECTSHTVSFENTKSVLAQCLCHLTNLAELQQKQIVRMRRKLYRLEKKVKDAGQIISG